MRAHRPSPGLELKWPPLPYEQELFAKKMFGPIPDEAQRLLQVQPQSLQVWGLASIGSQAKALPSLARVSLGPQPVQRAPLPLVRLSPALVQPASAQSGAAQSVPLPVPEAAWKQMREQRQSRPSQGERWVVSS